MANRDQMPEQPTHLSPAGRTSRRPSSQVSGWQKQSGIQTFRQLNQAKSLQALAADYGVLALAAAGAILADTLRRRAGLHWAASAPFFAMAAIAIGGVQHRLASLGHEASHYTFLKNRLANDLLADIFCMFPL
ncbi:MAG: hypothetical protein ACKO5E_10760, partial [bacterium]